MSQKYENIMVAVDGSHEAELAFEKGVNVSLRNGSKLTIVHVIDTRALQSVSTFDAEVYEELQEEANELLKGYKERAEKVGVQNIATVVEMGNQRFSWPMISQARKLTLLWSVLLDSMHSNA